MLPPSIVRALTLLAVVLASTLAGCQSTGRSVNNGTAPGTTANPGGGGGGGGGGAY